MKILLAYIFLQEQMSREATFWFWFGTEVFFGIFVFLLLYFFIVKNKDINPQRKKRDDEHKAN